MITASKFDFIRVVYFLDRGDLCPLTFAVLLLIVFGRALTSEPQQKWCAGLAAVASLIYAASLLVRLPPYDGDSFLGLTVRVLVAFGLAWGVAMIIVAALSFLFVHTLGSAWSKLQLRLRLAWQHWIERKARRRAEQFVAQDFPDTLEAEQPDEDWQAQLEAEREAQKSKEDARTRCELLYALHAPELEKRFPKETFDDFVKRHLKDENSAEHVESRAKQLEEIIRQHLEKVQPSRKLMSLDSLNRWYKQRRQQVIDSEEDEDFRDSYLMLLQTRYDELVRHLIEELEP